MALTLILGDQLHREWLEASPLQLRAGQPVLMIEDLAVASAYRYHRLRLLHTFVAMRSFRDALLERGIAVRYFELPYSLEVPFWRRLAAELEAGHPGQGSGLQVAEIADRGFEQLLQHCCWEQGWCRPWDWPRSRRPMTGCSSRSGS
jgi:deoxyribodipyrimidine photolyase-related protein